MLQDSQRDGTPKQFCRKQCFIVAAQIQQTYVKRLSPENKGDLLYIPLQADYRSIWLHTISLVTLSSVLHDASYVQLPQVSVS
jgi:hypothetical protein